jgi:hypothetical protein
MLVALVSSLLIFPGSDALEQIMNNARLSASASACARTHSRFEPAPL